MPLIVDHGGIGQYSIHLHRDHETSVHGAIQMTPSIFAVTMKPVSTELLWGVTMTTSHSLCVRRQANGATIERATAVGTTTYCYSSDNNTNKNRHVFQENKKEYYEGFYYHSTLFLGTFLHVLVPKFSPICHRCYIVSYTNLGHENIHQVCVSHGMSHTYHFQY